MLRNRLPDCVRVIVIGCLLVRPTTGTVVRAARIDGLLDDGRLRGSLRSRPADTGLSSTG